MATSTGTTDVDETATLWNLAHEPQLVLVPVPRIGFINVETAIAHSAYGVSGGLTAIF